MDQVKTILATARGAQVNTALADASISMSGMTPYFGDLRDYTIALKTRRKRPDA